MRSAREPGVRRNASQIIARATLMSSVVVLILGGVAIGAIFLTATVGEGTSSLAVTPCATAELAVSVGAAVVLILALNLITWADIELIACYLPGAQSVGLVMSYVLKLAVLLVAYVQLHDFALWNASVFFVSFGSGIVLALVVISFVVIREEGPDIEFIHE